MTGKLTLLPISSSGLLFCLGVYIKIRGIFVIFKEAVKLQRNKFFDQLFAIHMGKFFCDFRIQRINLLMVHLNIGHHVNLAD